MSLRGLLVVAIVAELALGGLLATRWRPVSAPKMPAAFPDDPPFAAEVADLAAAARYGGKDAWMALGDALLGKGAYPSAESAYRRATGLSPLDIDARFALAFCIDRTGRMTEANAEYEKCLELPDPPGAPQSKKPFALYAIGRNLLRLEDELGAEAAFRRNPGFPPADYQLARILLFSGRPMEALEVVERGLDRLPLALEWHRLRGRILDALGRPAEAFAARAMEERSAHLVEVNFNVDYIRPLTAQYGIQRMLRDYAAAMEREPAEKLSQRLDAIATAIGERIIPERTTLMQLRVDLAMRSGNPQDAVDRIAAEPLLRDSDPLIAAYEADALEQLGKQDEATARRKRLVAIAPTPGLHRKLATACDRSGDETGRDRHLAEAERLEGIAVYRRNDITAAMPRFERAANLDPSNSAALFHWGEMLYHLDRPEEAALVFRKAIDRRPGFGRAGDFLTYLSRQKSK
jgi:tetratricopeptide (TPR) repeat protein